MKFKTIHALVLICLFFSRTACFATDHGQKRPLLVANYYAWYHDGEHARWPWAGWTRPEAKQNALALAAQRDGEPPPSSTVRPLTGLYDSADSAVAEWHVKLAQAAGIDAFLVDWWGLHKALDRNIDSGILAAAEKHGFKMALLDERAQYHNDWEWYKNAAVQALARYKDSAAYLRISGKPVYYLYQVAANPTLTPDKFAELKRHVEGKVGPVYWIVDKIAHDHSAQRAGELDKVKRIPADWLAAEGVDAFAFYSTFSHFRAHRHEELAGKFRYMTRQAHGAGKKMVLPVHPGHDNSHFRDDPYVMPRRNGETLRDYLRAATDAGADMVMITSWNEWPESTVIEPSSTWPDPYLYLKIIADWKGKQFTVPHETITLKSLLNEMTDRYSLTRLCRPAYLAKAATSYDRASKVNDPADGLYVEKKGRDWGKGWFANRDFGFFLREEKINGRTEKVLMDDSGPGAIVRWWATANNNGMIRIYLDGASKPVIAMKPAELVGGGKLTFYPFSFKASDDRTNPPWRGHNLYLPIPYQKGCKVTWEGAPSYYQIGYRKYAPGTQVKTFTMDQLEGAKETMKQVAARLATGSGVVKGKKVNRTDVVLGPEGSTTLHLSKPGAITKLLVQLTADDYRQALRSTVVTMTFDGKRTAWIPVGSLGGVGYSAENNDTYYAKVDQASGTISVYYVMPFRDKAAITLINHGRQDVTIKNVELTVDDYQWDDRSLHFHATWFELRNISTHARSDLNYVTIKGAGRYVGTAITVFNTCTLPNNQTWWGEGDDKVHVDGEPFPSIFGTGTEDYFGYAYCRPQRFHTPFISQPRGEGNKKWGYTNNNRYHLLDDMPFNKSLKFDMEIWHPFRKNMNYAAATYFYARPGATHNVVPKVDSARHKVALHRDDVVSLEEITAPR